MKLVQYSHPKNRKVNFWRTINCEKIVFHIMKSESWKQKSRYSVTNKGPSARVQTRTTTLQASHKRQR